MAQHNQHPNVDDLHQAETTIVKLIQGEVFPEEMKILRSSQGNTSNRQGWKMADLPSDRLEPARPITYCGVYYFGPWQVKEGRKELKRYGDTFTCLASRVIHLEVAISFPEPAIPWEGHGGSGIIRDRHTKNCMSPVLRMRCK